MISTLLFVSAMAHSPSPAYPPLPNPSPAYPPLPSNEGDLCYRNQWCASGFQCQIAYFLGFKYSRCVIEAIGGHVGDHCLFGVFCKPGLSCVWSGSSRICMRTNDSSASRMLPPMKGQLGAAAPMSSEEELGAQVLDPWCNKGCAVSRNGKPYCADLGQHVDDRDTMPSALSCPYTGKAVCVMLNGPVHRIAGWRCEEDYKHEFTSGQVVLGASGHKKDLMDPWCPGACVSLAHSRNGECYSVGSLITDKNTYPSPLNCRSRKAECTWFPDVSVANWACYQGDHMTPELGQAPSEVVLGASGHKNEDNDPWCPGACVSLAHSHNGECYSVGSVITDKNTYPSPLNCRSRKAECTWFPDVSVANWACYQGRRLELAEAGIEESVEDTLEAPEDPMM